MIPLSSWSLIARSYSSSCSGFWPSLFKDCNLLWLKLRFSGSRSWASFHGRPTSYLWFLTVIVSLNFPRTEFSSCLIPVDSNFQKVRSFLLNSMLCTSISSLRASIRSTCFAAKLIKWVSERGAFSTGTDNFQQILCSLQQVHSLLFWPLYLQFSNTDLLQWEYVRKDSLLKYILTKQCPSSEHDSSLQIELLDNSAVNRSLVQHGL